MSEQRKPLLFIACVACALFQLACSTRGWYEGFRETRRRRCYEQPSQSQVDRCLKEVNAATYSDYQRAREDSTVPKE